jgi:type VII secretion effector (TIGR04197 family)
MQVVFQNEIHEVVEVDESCQGYGLRKTGSSIIKWVRVEDCKEITDDIHSNSILNNVHNLLIKQTNKGLQKYGTTVNKDDYSTLEWIEHAQEELTDALVYLETLKTKIKDVLG